MAKLNAVDKGEEGRILDGGFLKDLRAHPEYPFAKCSTKG